VPLWSEEAIFRPTVIDSWRLIRWHIPNKVKSDLRARSGELSPYSDVSGLISNLAETWGSS